ncbi:MAG TPA: M20/M25/M40 family metallo-hydrolase, partial [Fimbriimonadaceae bacterium]|nr:M20/M25/M40 family metallo-hydrolase [Fimbriimonadaceae bacterium]
TNNWTAGTKGPVKGPAVIQPKSVEEVKAMGEKLRSAWILMPNKVSMGGPRPGAPTDIDKALDAAGIAGRVYSTGRDLVWSHGRYAGIDPKHLPDKVLISLRGKDFDAVTGYLGQGKPVTLEFNVDNRFTGKPQPVYNVVGEIPGTDKADEVVVIGGHFDSWNSPGSEGAADNGTGSMIALEAARIIKATRVPHRRTLRVILYSGEEEGLLGSAGYVKAHKDELSKIVGVLNDDEGTNAETGFTMLKGAETLLQPLPGVVNAAFPAMPININYGDRLPTGGSDHGSFIGGGVPAISWGKADKPVSYTYIWHTQNDTLENTYPDGLIQSSTCSALTAFLLLNSDGTLPRPRQSTRNAG